MSGHVVDLNSWRRRVEFAGREKEEQALVKAIGDHVNQTLELLGTLGYECKFGSRISQYAGGIVDRFERDLGTAGSNDEVDDMLADAFRRLARMCTRAPRQRPAAVLA